MNRQPGRRSHHRGASNAAGQAQHIAANHRPRSSLLLLSRLVDEKLAGTPYAKYFLTSES